MARTLEVAYIASTSDLERGNLRAGASTEAAAATMAAANAKAGGSYVSLAGAGKKAAAEIESSGGRIGSSLVGIGRSSNVAIAGLVGLSAAAYGIKKSADALAEIGKETLTLHNVTGLNIKTASAYAAVAKAQDLPVKGLNQAFGTLSKNLQAVENAHNGLTKGAKTQENAFKLLGLPIRDIIKAHGDMNKLLPEVTRRFEEMPASQHKAAVGMALFGRGWQTLVPLMHTGALGLKEQLDVADKMGATLGGKSVKDLKQFAKAQEESKYATLGLQLAVGQYLAPALTKLIVFLAKVSHSLGEGVHWLQEHGTAAKALAGVITGTLGLALAVFVSSRAKKFIAATQDMIGAMSALAAKVGRSSASVEGSLAGQATAAQVSAAKVGTAVAGEAATVEAADTKIVAANRLAGASFTALLGPIGLAVAAAYGLKEASDALGITNPSKEGFQQFGKNLTNAGLKKSLEEAAGRSGSGSGRGAEISESEGKSHTQGGIMGFFMAKGLTAAQAAGIVGNIEQESGTNPRAAGGGLFQGIGSRAGLGKGSVKQQIEAAWNELQGSERGTLSLLRKARSPEEAARIFSEHFERPGTPMLANRERYAAEAFRRHPQHAAAAPAEERVYHPASGGAPHGAAQVRSLVEQYVDPFAGATGVSRGRTDQGVDFGFGGSLGAIGPGVVEKVANFQGFGETVVYRLTSGPRKGQRIYVGLETGGKATVHAGQSLRAGQQIAHGYGSGGIEMGFADASGLPIQRYAPGQSHSTPLAGGEAFSKFLASIGKGGSNLQLATAQFGEAAKRVAAAVAHLILSPAQEAKVTGLLGTAAGEHATAQMYGGYATEAASVWEHARSLQEKKRQPLSTAQGAHEATLIDQQDVQTAKARKLYYQREVLALGREAKAWGRLRDQYRSFARHAKGNAKKEALNKAAGYDGKVKTAQAEARALEGTIADTEAQIEEAQNVLTATLPGEIQAADLSAYQAANQKIDLEERAGLLSPEQAKAAKEANAGRALGGGYGDLSAEGRLQVQGDLREFAKATQEATSALEQHTQALKDSQKALNDFLHASEKLAGLENSTVLKAMADLISGQIGGVNYHGRAITAGAGSAARY